MYRVQVHKRINQIIELFYRMGLWHRGEEATVKETRIKLFYSIYYLLFPLSIIVGAIESDTADELIFLIEGAIVMSVSSVKLLYLIWKKKEIHELLHQIGVYSIEGHEEFTIVNDKLKRFMRFVVVFMSFVFFAIASATLVVPFIGSEKKLFLTIGFPLDWKNNEIGFWFAVVFIFTEATLTAMSVLFSILMWYLMINCALRYEILGHQIKKMGAIKTEETLTNKRKVSDTERHNLFLKDLISAIESHKHIKELTNRMVSFLSEIFLAQIGTSASCICCSIYCLIFSTSENYMEYIIQLLVLLYNIFDIFMVMYLGNEIQLLSDKQSYCLFESNWTDQPQSTKKSIIIFGEFLRQPHTLVIGKLYPLTLETFTRILNTAYSMFNILQNLK